MAHVINLTFQLKRGTAARWNEINPILSQGEPGFELDTNKLKIGDGTTAWNDLPYLLEDIFDIIPDEEAIAAIAERHINNVIGLADNLDDITLQNITNLVDYVEANGGQISELCTQIQELNATTNLICSETETLKNKLNNIKSNKYLNITGTETGITITFDEDQLKLSNIAKTGNVNDLQQAANDYLHLDCGTALINI